ncbi:MAG: outer membrane beta-barrel protein [Bacteroidales bacterium]|nr:outer membrane beta-barrel protein [Bacteroidales bacterium]MBN2748924.1 outer membrane beta-barrel protein [Bacteroidales bacterium]
MNEQELIGQYRNRVENSSAQAPQGLWDDIANQLDVDEVWTGVSNQLDIDDVWEGISAELDSDRRSRSIWVYVSWAASVALLATMGVVAYWLTVSSPVVQPSVITLGSQVEVVKPVATSPAGSGNENLITNPTAQHSAVRSNNAATGEPLAAVVSYKPAETNGAHPQNNPLVSDAQEDGQVAGVVTLGTIAPQQAVVHKLAVDSPSMALGNFLAYAPSVAPVTKERSGHLRALSVGATSAIKNTWLFGSETMEGLERNSLTKSDVKVYPDFGFNVRYGFSPRWSAESSLFFKSRTGQSYKEYIYGRYSSKDIALYYTQVELVAKYSSTKRWLKSNSYGFTTSLGMFYSNLTSASETIAGESKSVDHRYSSSDYGFVLGQDVEVMLTSRIVLSPGLRLKWGLPNIYAGEANIPSSLKRTHNRSLEFRFTLYYNIFR